MEAEEIGARLQDLRAQLHEWQALKNCIGWRRLADVLTAQKNFRVGNILRKPTEQLVDLAIREYERGEAASFDMAIELPNVEISRLQDEITLWSSRITTEENTNVSETLVEPESAP